MKTSDVIKHYGTQVEAGIALGCHQSSISGWAEYPPDARQLQIERLTNGELKAEPGCLDRLIGINSQRPKTYKRRGGQVVADARKSERRQGVRRITNKSGA